MFRPWIHGFFNYICYFYVLHLEVNRSFRVANAPGRISRCDWHGGLKLRRSRSSLSTKFFGRCKRAQACKFKGNQTGLLDPLPCVSFLVAECLGYLKNLRFLVLFITKSFREALESAAKTQKKCRIKWGLHLLPPFQTTWPKALSCALDDS